MINTARLLRRISKYCGDHSGGKAQSGETRLGREALGDPTFLTRWRRGADIQETTLKKVDEFLTAKGY